MAVTKSKHFLFHYLLKQFQSVDLNGVHLLVGVSGGVDSMALLNVLLELKKVLSLRISVVHVHHGAKDKKQSEFQNQAAVIVKTFCMENHLTFYCNKSVNSVWLKGDKVAGNEAEMRKYRYHIFSDYIKESKADYLVLAHTADDLLETRLIRLIRGTGEQGLAAMSFKSNRFVRPFIRINRSRVMDYVRKQKIKWCEDPSNKSIDYSLRNWIRHEWLPQLEKHRPGSMEALSRSLDLIVCTADSNQKRIKKICQGLIFNQSLRRDIISSFSTVDTQKILAYYMRTQGFKNYRFSHILELLKQMKRPRKIFTFSLLGKTWKMSPHWLSLDRKI